MPQRIQRKRTKGWSTPLCSCGCGRKAIYVGRPSRWGNPFAIGSNASELFVHDGRRVWWSTPRSDSALMGAHIKAVELFELHIGPMGNYEYDDDTLAALHSELRGHDLMCWCPLEDEHGNRVPCHADVLLELSNCGDT